MMPLFVGHDLGTGGNKAVLVDAQGNVLAHHVVAYGLEHPRAGWAEQDPDTWWRAVAGCTRALLEKASVSAQHVTGIGFAGQMLSLIALDATGAPTRRPIIWLDGRAEEQAQRMIRRFGGERVLHWLAGASPTGKDIVAKIAWIEQNEPEVYRRTALFADATGYLVARATGRVAMDPTAAGATGLLDLKSRRWARVLCALASFPRDKMPELVASTEVAGALTQRSASDLGLREGTPVAMGMADIPAAAVGSGAVQPGDAHMVLGTSAWIGVTVKVPKSVPAAGIASVPTADRTGCLMIGESETAGACRDWFSNNIGANAQGLDVDALAEQAEAGAQGLLFLPWMFGERSPVHDTRVRAAFVNLSLEHGLGEMARAVYEGVGLNLRWILDACGRVGEPCESLRAIGGGAMSDVWLSIIANVVQRPVERVAHPQQAGALGAAMVAAVAVGAIEEIGDIKGMIRVERTFMPDPSLAELYKRAHEVFRELYPHLSRAGRLVRQA